MRQVGLVKKAKDTPNDSFMHFLNYKHLKVPRTLIKANSYKAYRRMLK